MPPQFEVQLKIQRPVAEVFEAVVDPQQLSRYFVQAASGPLVEGATVYWRFAEVPGEHPVMVRQVVPGERIVLGFEATAESDATTVEMRFVPLSEQETMVQIAESGWRDTPEGIANSYGNCGGWMHMMCCMKAHLEHGINLRAGGAR